MNGYLALASASMFTYLLGSSPDAHRLSGTNDTVLTLLLPYQQVYKAMDSV